MGHAGKWVLRSGGIVCFSVVEGGGFFLIWLWIKACQTLAVGRDEHRFIFWCCFWGSSAFVQGTISLEDLEAEIA